MIRLFSLLFLLGFALAFSATPVQEHGRLQVSGSKIVDKNGDVVTLRGMSLFWSQWSTSFYNGKNVDWLVQDWKINLIRAAMGVDGTNTGYLVDSAAEKARVDTIVNAAVRNGIYVIIDWHDHTANLHTAEAKAFFGEMAKKYKDLPNVIWEIWNEPLDTALWLKHIKPYAEAVIPEIRKYDTDNLIVVGTRAWSQRVDDVIGNTIQDPNVAYTLHFYVGTHGQSLRDIADKAIDAGLPLFVTEWGIWDAGYLKSDYTNPVDIDQVMAWMDWLKENQISSAMWSVNDKDEPSAVLLPGASSMGAWDTTDLTTAGLFIRSYLRGMADGTWVTPENEEIPPDTIPLPGRLEAEAYVTQSGIQVEKTEDSEGDRNVGYIENGDYAEYTILVSEAKTYPISVRFASETTLGSLRISVDGTEKLQLDIPVTGGWQVWSDATGSLTLPAGLHTLRLDFLGVAGEALYNLNYIDIGYGSAGIKNAPKKSGLKLPSASRQFDLLGRHFNREMQ
jgi:aryl-phospho-beta-D-glucosidase BglC (GH1 family)